MKNTSRKQKVCPAPRPQLTPSLWSFCGPRKESVSMLSSSSTASPVWLMCRVLSMSARASAFTVSHTDSNSWGSWEISPPSSQIQNQYKMKSWTTYQTQETQPGDGRHTLTVKPLDLEHGNESREDLGFGSLHHLLVRLQDALQDQGEGRQDVRRRRDHTADRKREDRVHQRYVS